VPSTVEGRSNQAVAIVIKLKKRRAAPGGFYWNQDAAMPQPYRLALTLPPDHL